MELAKITVSANRLAVTQLQKAVAGTVGATVSVEYDETWNDMDTKMLVWRAGSVTIDDMDATGVVPPEVLAQSGRELFVGVYGTKGDTVAIPTLWGNLGLIYSGADPSGDTSTTPTLPVWAQLANRIAVLEKKPVDPELVKGIVETYLQENGHESEDYVLTEADMTAIAKMAAEMVEIPEGGSGGGIEVTGAEVGQTIVVKAVDENGKPTEWECASRASGEFPLIAEVILTEEVSSITIDTDLNGNPIDIAEAYVELSLKGGTPNEESSEVTAYWNKINTAVQRHTVGSKRLPAASTDTNVPNNQWLDTYHYQQFKYGYAGPGFGNSDGRGKYGVAERLRCFNSAEFNGYVADRFTAYTLFCATSGYTFGVGSRIRIYGR